MTPFVTVIIPFYNAELTFKGTLESLASCKSDELEFLFVNDGSTDRSAEILDRFLNRLPKLRSKSRVITHESNRGCVASFLDGVREAAGEYVIKCDADDHVTTDYYRNMIHTLRGTDNTADIVCSPIMRSDCKKLTRIEPYAIMGSLNYMPIDTVHFSLNNKIIRRSLFEKNNLMDENAGNCWDDLLHISRLLASGASVAYCSDAGYIYMNRQSSVSHSDSPSVAEERCTNARIVEQWMRNAGLARKYDRFLVNMKFHAKIRYLSHRPRNVKKWKHTFPEVNNRIDSINGLGRKYRILFKLASRLPWFML